jgi:hypothetical protein
VAPLSLRDQHVFPGSALPARVADTRLAARSQVDTAGTKVWVLIYEVLWEEVIFGKQGSRGQTIRREFKMSRPAGAGGNKIPRHVTAEQAQFPAPSNLRP